MTGRRGKKSEQSEGEKSARRRDAVRVWFDKSDLANSMPKHAVDVVERICSRMVDHGDSLTRICKDKTVRGAPSLSTLLYWRRADPRINDALVAAKAARAEMRWAEFEEKLEDEFEGAAKTGDKYYIAATEKKMSLLYRARTFEVGKLLPAIYGDTQAKLAAAGLLDPQKRKELEDINARIEQMKQDGVVVEQQVLEVPLKSQTKDVPRKTEDQKDDVRGDAEADGGVVIDMPSKGAPDE